MRGADVTQEALFVNRQTADYVPAEHPLRPIRDILNTALRDMDVLVELIPTKRLQQLHVPRREAGVRIVDALSERLEVPSRLFVLLGRRRLRR
jgi:hypothetical protein